MALVTQEQLQKLVAEADIVEDESMDLMREHLPAIAIAALGDDREALRAVLTAYADALAELAEGVVFFAPYHEIRAVEYVQWLRAL